MVIAAPSATVRDALRAAAGDHIVFPDDARFDAARRPWNTSVDQHPFAVARPVDAQEVARVVRAAASHGLRVVPQSTGHGAGALRGADLGDAVLISLADMRGVEVDPEARTSRVAGGAHWHDVVDAAAPHGLTGMHGSAGDISVAGFVLHGGLSFYGRAHGLAVNSVRSVELVTAGGRLVTASADENSDLFWAIRGGGGAFGVVTALVIDLLPYADVYAGMLLWDAARAAEVSHAWAAFTRTAPETATTTLRIMHFPPIEEFPPFIRGRSVVVIDGVLLGEDAADEALLAPLRALGPEVDTFGRIPASAVPLMHMDPPEPSPAAGAHAMLRSFDDDTVDAYTQAAMTIRPMVSEVRQCGAAMSRRPAHAGAVGALDGDYIISTIDIAPVPEAVPHANATTHDVVDALAPWHSGGLALTFLDDLDVDPAPGFGASLERLRAARATFDPASTMVGARAVR